MFHSRIVTHQEKFIIVHKYLITELTRGGRQQQYVLVRAICLTTGGGSICLGITYWWETPEGKYDPCESLRSLIINC